MLIGVISYLPDEEPLRSKRLQAVLKQRVFLNKVFPSAKLISVRQQYNGYEPSIRREKEQVVSFEQGVGVQRARNICLEHFYGSDENWLILIDDDITLYPHYQPETLFAQLEQHPDDFEGIDAFVPFPARYLPFKKQNREDPLFESHYKFIRKSKGSGMQMLVLRNIKKDYGETMYFDSSFDVSAARMNEDILFGIEFSKIYSLFTTMSAIMKFEAHTASTIFQGNREQEEKEYVRNTLRHIGRADLIVNDRIQWRKLSDVTPDSLYVKRRNSYGDGKTKDADRPEAL